MRIEDVIDGLFQRHIGAIPPWARRPADGWYVVVSYSAYDPSGFSITVNPAHYVINGMVARALEQLGLEVEWHQNYSAMEAHQVPKIVSATQSDP